MNPTLPHVITLPPPTPCPRIFASLDCAGARLAPDRGITLLVEAVYRDLVFFDVVPHIVVFPVGEWVELYDASGRFIELDLTRVAPVLVLVSAQA
jgi:hypothetical protein